jgi:hypothetical protein
MRSLGAEGSGGDKTIGRVALGKTQRGSNWAKDKRTLRYTPVPCAFAEHTEATGEQKWPRSGASR